MTGITASGKRRRSKQRYRRFLNSIIRGLSSALNYKSGLSFTLRISPAYNRKDFLWGLLAICGVVAPIVLIALIFVGAAVTSGYNHVSDPISQLAAIGSPHPVWLRTGFIVYGILVVGFGFVLYRSVREHRMAWLVVLFYFLHGIGFLLGGIFSDDPRIAESVSTASGILHNVWIIIGCSSFVAGMFVFAWLKRNDPSWRLFARIFFVVLILILLAFIIAQVPALAPAEGLLQRVYGFLAIVLIEMAAVRLLVAPKHRHIESGEASNF